MGTDSFFFVLLAPRRVRVESFYSMLTEWTLGICTKDPRTFGHLPSPRLRSKRREKQVSHYLIGLIFLQGRSRGV